MSIALLAVPVRIYAVSVHPLPFGFAGLYTLMAETISSHHYALPDQLPFYGPGGVPFAYPPLALYLMAATHDLFGIASFTYLRYAPLVFTSLYIVPLYLLYKVLASSSLTAFLATSLALTSPDILVYHEFADGVVRAFAFLCLAIGLLFAVRAVQNRQLANVCAAGVLFAATIASHPANALFFAITLALLVVTGSRTRPTWTVGAMIAAGGVIVSAPWWVTIIHRHGFGVFVHALSSHNSSATSGSGPLHLLTVITDRFWPIGVLWYPEYVLAIVGCVICLWRRQWFLPIWLAITVFFMPDYARFVGTVVALLASIAIVDAADAVRTLRPSCARFALLSAYLATTSLLGLVLLAGFFYWAVRVNPLLASSDTRTAAWMRGHTPDRSTFAVVTTRRELAEWYPFLLRRTPVIAEWGAEWTGNAGTQHVLFDAQAACARRQSLSCLNLVFGKRTPSPDYLVVARPASRLRLSAALRSSSSWSLMYDNGGDAVWKHL